MADPTKPFSSPAEQLAARGILAAAHGLMDAQARELFDLWFSGTAPPVVEMRTPAWATYMKADKGLEQQIDRHLLRYAAFVRDQNRAAIAALRPGGPPFFQAYSTSFHAEVGSASGGYNTGYTVLHGSNRAAGDFQMSGSLALLVPSGKTGELVARYSNNVLTFNDIVDPNYRYASDASFANLARNLSIALEKPKPRDFIVRIIWSEPGPWDYVVETSATWLKTFNNR